MMVMLLYFIRYQRERRDTNLVFLHGSGQSRVCWQTTADGREGFDTLFMRKGYGVYLIDQPGRGEAGQTANPVEVSGETQDQNWYTQFRIGLYPERYEGSQFPEGEEALDQFFRQMTPNTGNYSFEELLMRFRRYLTNPVPEYWYPILREDIPDG